MRLPEVSERRFDLWFKWCFRVQCGALLLMASGAGLECFSLLPRGGYDDIEFFVSCSNALIGTMVAVTAILAARTRRMQRREEEVISTMKEFDV